MVELEMIGCLKVRHEMTSNGYSSWALCPVCGNDVYLGTVPHRDECPPDYVPMGEIIRICYRNQRHFRYGTF